MQYENVVNLARNERGQGNSNIPHAQADRDLPDSTTIQPNDTDNLEYASPLEIGPDRLEFILCPQNHNMHACCELLFFYSNHYKISSTCFSYWFENKS